MMDGLNRAITRLARCSVRIVPAERREWAEAVWAEAGEVPDHGRLSWVGGGLWRVAREAGIVRRIVYWLGVAALAVGAAEVVSLVWQGASVAPGFRSISSPTTSMGAGVYVDPHTTGEFRLLAIATLVLLAALPWVARRRGAFGPVSDNSAARVVRVGGCAAICVLVLVLSRLAQTLGEDLAAGNSWPLSAEVVGVITTSLTVIPVAARRWGPGLASVLREEATTLRELIPLWVGMLAIGGGLVLFVVLLFLDGTWLLITAYVAGIFKVTARGSRIAPTTLVYGAGAGIAGGLSLYATAWAGRDFAHMNPWATLVIVLVLPAMMFGASAAAARRTSGRSGPEALRRECWRDGVVAGALTGGAATLLVTILNLGTMVLLHRQFPARSTETYLFADLFTPLLGMLIGSIAGWWSADAVHLPTPPPESPPSVLSVN
jgi:hypothetical protein